MRTSVQTIERASIAFRPQATARRGGAAKKCAHVASKLLKTLISDEKIQGTPTIAGRGFAEFWGAAAEG